MKNNNNTNRGKKYLYAFMLSTLLLQTAPHDAYAISQSQVTSNLSTVVSSQTGKTWSNGSYGLGIQCYEFAHYTFNNIFSRGKVVVGSYASPNEHILTGRPSDIVQVASLGSTQTTVSAVKEALLKAAPGDFIQMKRSHGGPHSAIVTSVTSDRINYLDANSDGNNSIKTHSLTFAEFEAANQAFSIYRHKEYETTGSSQLVNNGQYILQSKLGHNMVLDVAGGSTSNSANIQLYSYNGTSAQTFNLAYNSSSGSYSISNQKSSKVLDVNTSSNNVIQYSSHGQYNQQWYLEDAGDGYFYIKSGTGRYLDVSGNKSSNGTNIQVYTKNGSDAQKFKFVSVGLTAINNKTPMQAYIASSTTKAKTYSSIGGAWDGVSEIYVNDLCTIHEVYSNGYSKVSYPVSNGTKTAYAKTSDFFPFATSSALEVNYNQKFTAYQKSNGAKTFGTVYSSDTVTTLGRSGSYIQVIYPVDSGYKLAWVKG